MSRLAHSTCTTRPPAPLFQTHRFKMRCVFRAVQTKQPNCFCVLFGLSRLWRKGDGRVCALRRAEMPALVCTPHPLALGIHKRQVCEHEGHRSGRAEMEGRPGARPLAAGPRATRTRTGWSRAGFPSRGIYSPRAPQPNSVRSPYIAVGCLYNPQ